MFEYPLPSYKELEHKEYFTDSQTVIMACTQYFVAFCLVVLFFGVIYNFY